MKLKHFYRDTIKKHIYTIVIIVSLCIPPGIWLAYKLNSNDVLSDSTSNTVRASQPTPVSNISQPSVFRDSISGTVLSIQLASGQTDTGQFDFFVPQIGYYHGSIPLKQSGQQIIHPQGTVTAQLYPLNSSAQVSAMLRMEGEINTAHNTASLNIWINNTHYHLTTAQGDVALGQAAAKETLSAITSQNWSALYGLLALGVQATTTQAQLIQLMTGNDSQKIIAADINGQGNVYTVGGYTYFSQPVTLTVQQQDGSTATFHSIEYFILEQGNWRLLTTNTPTP